MKNFYLLVIIFTTFFLFSGCQTVKNKTDAIVEKENKRLSKYIGKSSDKLKIDLGNPDEDFKNEKGNNELIYNNWICFEWVFLNCLRRYNLRK